jgi:hypothetical protein
LISTFTSGIRALLIGKKRNGLGRSNKKRNGLRFYPKQPRKRQENPKFLRKKSALQSALIVLRRIILIRSLL